MNSKLVSVIMPVYNGQDFVSRCIDSILNQTYKNIEVILVDDGSTDNTGRILDEYKKNNKEIIVIHQQNKGQSSARNAGLDIFTGHYITFIDADDFYHTDFVTRTVELCEKYNADISQTSNDIGTSCDFRKTDNSHIKIDVFEQNSIFETAKYKTVPWAKMYKRHLFDDVRYPSSNVVEDEGVAYQTIYYANKVICTSEKLYYAYMTKESVSRGVKKYDIRFMEVFEDRLAFFKQRDEQKLYDISVVKYALALSIKYMRMYCGRINTKQELTIVKNRFDELYNDAVNSQYIIKRHKRIIKSFKAFPKCTAILEHTVTKVKRSCGYY